MWWLLWTYLILALAMSFLCSLLEAALLAVPAGHVNHLCEQGRRYGHLLQRMKANIDRPLSAILTLNTVAHTVGAAGVGAEAVDLFGHQWVGLVSAVLTLLILVFSEIIPKTLGVVHAKRLAAFTAYTISLMVWCCYPLVVVFRWLSDLIAGGAEPERLSRAEVLSMARLGEADGVLSPVESRAITNLLHLRQIRVKDIMTPRAVIFALSVDTRVSELMTPQGLPRFARIPIYRRDLDDLCGLVHRYRIIEAWSQGQQDLPLDRLVMPLRAVPETASVAQVLEQFVEHNVQFFQVVDEFGGTAGVVTLEDALETLLGVEIVDETDSVADLRQLARQRQKERRRQF